jgi:hypothetical protein
VLIFGLTGLETVFEGLLIFSHPLKEQHVGLFEDLYKVEEEKEGS